MFPTSTRGRRNLQWFQNVRKMHDTSGEDRVDRYILCIAQNLNVSHQNAGVVYKVIPRRKRLYILHCVRYKYAFIGKSCFKAS